MEIIKKKNIIFTEEEVLMGLRTETLLSGEEWFDDEDAKHLCVIATEDGFVVSTYEPPTEPAPDQPRKKR